MDQYIFWWSFRLWHSLILRFLSFLKTRLLYNQGDNPLLHCGCVCVYSLPNLFIIQSILEKKKVWVNACFWHDSESLQRWDSNLGMRKGGNMQYHEDLSLTCISLTFLQQITVSIWKCSFNFFYIPLGRWISSLYLYTSPDRDPHTHWGSPLCHLTNVPESSTLHWNRLCVYIKKTYHLLQFFSWSYVG